MTKFGFYFQKLAIIVVLIAAMITVIPFILIAIEAAINGNGAFGYVMLEHIFITTFAEWSNIDEVTDQTQYEVSDETQYGNSGTVKPNDPKDYYENHMEHFPDPKKQG